jgi:membrane protein CcdC involved in cytochrome C biogenesis
MEISIVANDLKIFLGVSLAVVRLRPLRRRSVSALGRTFPPVSYSCSSWVFFLPFRRLM